MNPDDLSGEYAYQIVRTAFWAVVTSIVLNEGKIMNRNFRILALSSSLALTAMASDAATIDIRDAADTFTFASLTYTGLDSDVVGFFAGVENDTKAQWYPDGDNGEESDLVELLGGFPVNSVDLGGTEATISGSSFDVAGNTYFTTKFGQSLAVFLNKTASTVTISFEIDEDCKDNAPANNQCGGLSHSKQIEGDSTPVVPLPAAGWMLMAGVGGLGAMRRRKKA